MRGGEKGSVTKGKIKQKNLSKNNEKLKIYIYIYEPVEQPKRRSR